MSGVGVEFGVPYTLLGPDGTKAVFNDDSDTDFVGILGPDTSGLDSPDVREDTADKVGADGGVHGSFYYGRRPVVLVGTILAISISDRNDKSAAIKAASNAMRADAVLSYTPTGSSDVLSLALRRQQPVRITGGFTKSFQVPMVAADPRWYGQAVSVKGITTKTVTADGNVDTGGVIKVAGPVTDPSFENATTGETINLTVTLAGGHYIEIDLTNRTIVQDGTTNVYKYFDYDTSAWWGIQPGNNNLVFSDSADLTYSPAWI